MGVKFKAKYVQNISSVKSIRINVSKHSSAFSEYLFPSDFFKYLTNTFYNSFCQDLEIKYRLPVIFENLTT